MLRGKRGEFERIGGFHKRYRLRSDLLRQHQRRKFFPTVPQQFYSGNTTQAQQSGVVARYGNGTFGSNKPITREQLTAIFYRYAQYEGCDTAQGGAEIWEFAGDGSSSSYTVGGQYWYYEWQGNNLLDP